MDVDKEKRERAKIFSTKEAVLSQQRRPYWLAPLPCWPTPDFTLQLVTHSVFVDTDTFYWQHTLYTVNIYSQSKAVQDQNPQNYTQKKT